MVVQVQGIHLDLTDDRFSLVMDELEGCFRLLKRLGYHPFRVDVELEKTVRRAPQTRRGERLYRTEVEVGVSGRSLRAEGTADDFPQAIVRMAARLAHEIQAWNEQRTGERGTGARQARERSEDARPRVVSSDVSVGES